MNPDRNLELNEGRIQPRDRCSYLSHKNLDALKPREINSEDFQVLSTAYSERGRSGIGISLKSSLRRNYLPVG